MGSGSSSFVNKVLLPRFQPRVQQRRGDRGGGRRRRPSRNDDFLETDDLDDSFSTREYRPRGRGRGRGRRPKATPKTAAELDQELDDYHKKTGSSFSGQPSGFSGQPAAPSDS